MDRYYHRLPVYARVSIWERLSSREEEQDAGRSSGVVEEAARNAFPACDSDFTIGRYFYFLFAALRIQFAVS